MTTQETQNKIRELENLRQQARFWGWGTTTLIILISLVSVGVLANSVHNLFQPGPTRDQFASTLTGNLKRDVLPQVQEIATTTLSESRPQVETAFSSLNTRVPELTGTFMKQFDMLRQNLPQRGDKALSTTYGAMLKQQEPKLRQMFPEATDANVATLVSTMTDEGQAQLVASNDTLFAKHTAAMNGIVTDLEKIQSTEHVSASDDQANWEMALVVVDAFHDDLQNLRVQNGPSGSAAVASNKAAETAAEKKAKP